MRVLHKVTVVATVLLSLTGCSSGANSTSSSSASASPTVNNTSTPTATQTIPTCASNQLSWLPGQEGVAMGHVGFTGVGLKNVSKTTCTLTGYPDLQMLDAKGDPIATHVLYRPSYTLVTQAEKLVLLTPGAIAMFDLGFDNGTGYGTSICPTSAQVKITPPGSTEPLAVSWQIQPYGGGTIPKLRCGEITVTRIYGPRTSGN